jgi:hypothetical protein
MEEEYRMQKTQSDIQQVLSATSTNGFSLPPDSVRDTDIGTAVIHEDGTVVRPSIDDQVSTRGIIAPSPPIRPVSIADANGNDDEPASAVPTIQNVNESSPAPVQEPFSFSNKRLCERWLDNLFMVLYEVGHPSFFVDLSAFNNRLS